MTRMTRVFEFRPGKRIRRGGWKKWICFGCAESAWRDGRFHDPVVFPSVDLAGVRCVICERSVVS